MSQVLFEALERARTAEAARAELQRRIDEELNPQIERLMAEKAAAETGKSKAETDTRKADAKHAEAEATAAARQAAIDTLTTERDTLSTRIEVLGQEIIRLDATRQEGLRQQAVAMRAEAEERDISKWRSWGTLIVTVLCAVTFIVLEIIGVEVKWTTRGWISTVAIGLAFFSPTIVRLIDKISPHVDTHWRKLAIGISLTISGFVSSLGHSGGEVWMAILLWIASFLGYGLLFQGFFESFRHLVKREEDAEVTMQDKLALGYLFTFIGGMIAGGIFPVGQSIGGSVGYMLSTLFSMAMMGVVFLSGMICYWFGSKVGANASGLFEKERRSNRRIDKWLRIAKLVCIFVAILVGYIVGSGYSYSNGINDANSYIMAVAIGFGVTMIYYLIEGKVLEACFLRKYRLSVLVSLVIGGTVFATLTAYLSFGKVYHVASAGQRLTEAKNDLVATENAYLAATESTCLGFAATEADPVNNIYTQAITAMKDAVKLASEAKTRDELDKSQRLFKEGGMKAVDCAGKKKGLLDKVKLLDDPTPSEMSSQYWLEGINKYPGPSSQAMVAVSVIDYLIVIASIFAWLFASPQIQTDDDGSQSGRIISLLGEGRCLIDIGSNKGVEDQDVLNVIGEKGEVIGSLTVEDIENLGKGACIARAASDKMQVAPGLRVRLAS